MSATSSDPTSVAVPARTRAGQWWLDAPLHRKLLSIVVLIALACVPPISIGILLDARLDEARRDARTTDTTVDELDTLSDSLTGALSAVRSYAILGFTDLQRVDDYRVAAEPIPDQLAVLQADVPPELAPSTRELVMAVDTFLGDLDALLEFGAAGSRPADVSDDPGVFEFDPVLVDDLVAIIESSTAAEESIDVLDRRLAERLADDRREIDRLQELLVWATLGSMIAALLAAAVVTYVVTTGMARRIERLETNAERFLRGAPLLPTAASTDEIGQLGRKMLAVGKLLDARREQAVTATRAKDDFLARVSHELKTPLTAMIGFGQMLEEDLEGSRAGHEDATGVVDAGHQLHGLIEELLDIRAIEAGKLALTITAVPVHEPAADAIAQVGPVAAERSTAISVDCPDDAVVAADRQRLREILVELLSNAVEHSDRGGQVEVVAERRGDTVRLRVTDDGPGISVDDQDRLFQPFERLDAPAGAGAGTGNGASGVGLALTRHVVEAMGGTIGVDSRPGRGATFLVDLPSAQAATSSSAVGSRPPAPDLAAARPPEPSERLAALVPPNVTAPTHAGRRWMDAPLRRKLLSIVALIALACLVQVAMGFRANTRLTDAQAETRELSRNIDQLDALQASVRDSTSAVQTYLVLGSADPEWIVEYRAAAAVIPDEVAALGGGVPADLSPLAQDLAAATDDLLAELDALADGTPAPGSDADGTVAFDVGSAETLAVVGGIVRALDAEGVIEEASDALESRLDARLADSRLQVDILQQRLVWATLASVVSAIVATVVVTYVVTNGIVRRIARLSENADRFLRGERLLPTMASADEIGRLADRVLLAGELLDARREEAVAATRAKDQFLSRVSHELKTPLTAMIDHGRSLEQCADLSPENREDAQHIVRAGRQLHDLIQEMLDIKAIEAGQLALSIEPVPVHEATEDAISLVRPAAANRSITLSADCPDDAVVSADRRRLREVLLNLLSNAVKYNREAGAVDVTATALDQVVRIGVTDDGPGISPADQQLLFRPFERLAAADTEVEGSGIGLSLTKHVVEAMDGTIGVTSRPGHGATFWFDLPTAERVRGADPDRRVGRRGATRG